MPSNESLFGDLQSLGLLGDEGAWAIACEKQRWGAEMTQYWWHLVAPNMETQMRLIDGQTDDKVRRLMIGIATDYLAIQATEAGVTKGSDPSSPLAKRYRALQVAISSSSKL